MKSSKHNKNDKDDDNEETGEEMVKKEFNRIYFYADVNDESCLELNRQLKVTEKELLCLAHNYSCTPPPIFIHINSNGGDIFAAMSVIDTIRLCKVKTISIVEGGAASAATMISVVADKRIITKNAHMLIHQLSSDFWGKMHEIEDEMKNLKKLMERIKHIYMEKANIPKSKLNKLLKHDLWLSSDECKKYGLVDKII